MRSLMYFFSPLSVNLLWGKINFLFLGRLNRPLKLLLTTITAIFFTSCLTNGSLYLQLLRNYTFTEKGATILPSISIFKWKYLCQFLKLALETFQGKTTSLLGKATKTTKRDQVIPPHPTPFLQFSLNFELFWLTFLSSWRI